MELDELMHVCCGVAGLRSYSSEPPPTLLPSSLSENAYKIASCSLSTWQLVSLPQEQSASTHSQATPTEHLQHGERSPARLQIDAKNSDVSVTPPGQRAAPAAAAASAPTASTKDSPSATAATPGGTSSRVQEAQPAVYRYARCRAGAPATSAPYEPSSDAARGQGATTGTGQVQASQAGRGFRKDGRIWVEANADEDRS